MGRELQPHAGVSSIDLILVVPKEETHDHCCWATYGVLQVVPRGRGGAGHPHNKRGMHQKKKGRDERAVCE
ncbi:unnamed protein product [Spirodela intermedia]|uniref:Uncharacterized protein n=1 Tax=Spirodela intermedia TaxID=51605 RepID=A0A7I8L833_SPIIN|nr:unnamed protein product [Spirodela intermedia]